MCHHSVEYIPDFHLPQSSTCQLVEMFLPCLIVALKFLKVMIVIMEISISMFSTANKTSAIVCTTRIKLNAEKLLIHHA